MPRFLRRLSVLCLTLGLGVAVLTVVSPTAGGAVAAPASASRAVAASVLPLRASAASAAQSRQLVPKLVPTENIPADPAMPLACYSDPRGSTCQESAIAALNHARTTFHQSTYSLPGGFRTLSDTEQLLVLSNLDRAVYHLTPVSGLDRALNAKAADGVRHDADPDFSEHLGGTYVQAGGSNWAGGYPTPLYAYYSWMYDDGPGSNNIDCTSSHRDGCWGHRTNTLFSAPTGTQVVMGAAWGVSPGLGNRGYTELYEAFDAAAPISYLPTVTGLSPRSGSKRGGYTVLLHGYGFEGVTGVAIGHHHPAFQVLSSTLIRVHVTAGTGVARVSVHTREGTNPATSVTFTYH